MSKTVDTFIALLRSAVAQTNEKIDLEDIDYEALFSLAKLHDLAHIICYELKKRGALGEGETERKFKFQFDLAAYRSVKRNDAIKKIRSIMESACIPFVLLKGTHLMDLYPGSWMRTSCDIDILVSEDFHLKAMEAFQKSGFDKIAETSHDASFSFQKDYRIELHHLLIEDNKLPNVSLLIKDIWENTTAVNDGYERALNDEMFYFYHLAHMAKHIKDGGCGIRSFLDLWILNHSEKYDKAKREKLLSDGGLLTFARRCESISEKWFSDNGNAFGYDEFEDYIIRGGVYGSTLHNVIVRKTKTDNRFVFYIKRIFLPYSGMKYAYPVLKKCPLLLPLFWVIRWFKLLDPSIRKRAVHEVNIERSASKDEGDKIVSIMKQLEIW